MATATGTTRTVPARRNEPLRLPRTTGAVSGLLIIVLGVWGGLIPFIGPYFHYSFGGDHTWHFTMQRLWLDILPGAVAVLGGFMLMTASSRVGGLAAGWIALIAGIWFAIGPAVALLWDQNIYAIGAPHGGSVRRMLEWVGYFSGVGVVIVGLAAFAMGRYFSRPRVAEEAGVVAAGAAGAAAAESHRRHEPEPVTRTAVADAAAEERSAVRDAPAEERAAVRDTPAEERTAVRDTPAEERTAGADAPATESRAADEPVAGTSATDTRAADARAADMRAADARPADARPADAPTTAVPTSSTSSSATTAGPAATTTRRRSGGLLGRFRR